MTGRKPTQAWAGIKRFLQEFFDFTGDNSLPFTLTENDVRIERGPWVYYIRAVHRGKFLRADLTPIDFLSLALYILLSGFVDDWRARRPWKVAVLRRRSSGMWRLEVLRKDLLPTGVQPEERRTELVNSSTQAISTPDPPAHAGDGTSEHAADGAPDTAAELTLDRGFQLPVGSAWVRPVVVLGKPGVIPGRQALPAKDAPWLL